MPPVGLRRLGFPTMKQLIKLKACGLVTAVVLLSSVLGSHAAIGHAMTLEGETLRGLTDSIDAAGKVKALAHWNWMGLE